MPEDYFDVYDWPEKKINPHRGWEIYERGIYDTLINLRDNYGNIPCYISENGMGSKMKHALSMPAVRSKMSTASPLSKIICGMFTKRSKKAASAAGITCGPAWTIGLG